MDIIESEKMHQLIINELLKNEKIIKSSNPPMFIEISGEFFHTDRFTHMNFNSLQYSEYFNIEKIAKNLNNRHKLRLQITDDLNSHKEMLKEVSSISKMILCNSSYIKNDSINENCTIDDLINIVEVFNEISIEHNSEYEKSENTNKRRHLNRINDGYYNLYDD